LIEGRDAAEELGFAPMAWQIDIALSRLVAETGDATRAAELRERARSVVDQLAASIDDDSLRASFLATPDVRAVVADGTLAP
jgi:hypothetical protein